VLALDDLAARLRNASPGLIYTLGLAVGLLVALAGAIYLSYWGGVTTSNAFKYQTAVVSAQRDAEVLQVEQFERKTPPAQLRAYEKLLQSDLARIDAVAENPGERAPSFKVPAKSAVDYELLYQQLHAREIVGRQRFDDSVSNNVRNRNLSNVLFAVVALLFTFFSARLRRRIEQGRSLVENLQRAFLSRRTELPNVRIGSVLISATEGEQIGGDIFDVYPIDGRYGAFLVADVSGKGVAAAVDTAFIKYAMRTLLSEVNDPGAVLTRFSLLYARNAESDDTFVVLFLGILDTQTGELRYASAGHEPAWLRTGNTVHILPPTGPIVGVLTDTEYGSQTAQMRGGDMLVVSTDGLTESRDAQGNMLDAEGVRRWIEQIDEGAQATADGIVRRLRRRSTRIDDDLAILVVCYRPTKTSSGIVTLSEAPKARSRSATVSSGT
jgi:serine phosphatase RsbU (regulator of sigma subunit)